MNKMLLLTIIGEFESKTNDFDSYHIIYKEFIHHLQGEL